MEDAWHVEENTKVAIVLGQRTGRSLLRSNALGTGNGGKGGKDRRERIDDENDREVDS